MAFSPITDLIKWRLKSRMNAIESMKINPEISQSRVLENLLTHMEETTYGKKYGVHKNMSYDEYKSAVPVVNYESLTPWIDRTMK